MQVKNIKKGVNPPSATLIYFSGPFLLKGFKIGVVTGLIALTVKQKAFFQIKSARGMAKLKYVHRTATKVAIC